MTKMGKDLLELERDLNDAVHQGQLRVHYQPIVELREGRLAGFEALVRWDHPQRGPVSPVDFIPLAEQTGLVLVIGAQVLDQALAHSRPGVLPIRRPRDPCS